MDDNIKFIFIEKIW